MTTRPPNAAAKIIRSDGTAEPELYRFLDQMAARLRSVETTLATVTGGEVQAVEVTQPAELPVFLESPTEQIKVILAHAANAEAYDNIYTICRQGTGVVRFLVSFDGIETASAYVPVASVLGVYPAPFDVPIGAVVAVQFSGVSGLENATVTAVGTRTLATA